MNRLRNPITALLMLAVFLSLAPISAFAAPLVVWDPGAHTWVQISTSSNLLAITSNTAVPLPDTLEVNCTGATGNAKVSAGVCWVSPNDGHVYKITGVRVDQLAAANGGSPCSFNAGVAPAGAPTVVSDIATPMACTTPGAINGTLGFAATPTTGATTPTPTPITLTGGNAIVYDPSFSATTTPVPAGMTISIQRSS